MFTCGIPSQPKNLYKLWSSYPPYVYISLLKTGYRGICALNFFLQRFRSWNFYEVKLRSWGSCCENFRSRCTIFFEIWSVEVRVFAGSWNSSQRSDIVKFVITLSMSIGLEFRKNWRIVNILYFVLYQFQRQMKKRWHVARRTSALCWNNQ